jgi:hypothetical protein
MFAKYLVKKPIIQLNALDRINLEINKRLYDYIL